MFDSNASVALNTTVNWLMTLREWRVGDKVANEYPEGSKNYRTGYVAAIDLHWGVLISWSDGPTEYYPTAMLNAL